MNRFFRKTKGAISVFLVLVLLPTLVFGGLVTDAARIYSSKVVISDAGEMAMNAALAQYNEDLLDEYGLLVMNSDPSSYDAAIREFFTKSLNGDGAGGGTSGGGSYSHLLDLVAENVNAIAVSGSEIYRSEVERQQIIEYMKYRAPLCLVDLVLEKLEAMKDTKKKAEAMEAEMDFAESMKKCQDAIEEARAALDVLWAYNNKFKDDHFDPPALSTPLKYIQNMLDVAKGSYTGELAKIHLMIAAISKYEKVSSNSLESMVNSFINEAGKVNMDNAPDSFNDYLNCLEYKKGVENAGGVEKIVDNWKESHQEPSPENEEIPESEQDSDETTRETAEHAKWREDLKAVQDIVDKYKSAANRISGYEDQLNYYAMDIIWDFSEGLSTCRKNAYDVELYAADAMKKLEALKPLIDDAKEKWQTWSDKEEIAYPEAETKASNEQKNFFTTEDSAKYDALVQKVQKVQDFYTELVPKLEEESFCGKTLSKEAYAEQYEAHQSKAKDILSGVEITVNDFSYNIHDYQDTFKEAYNHVELGGIVPSWSEYTEDDFYKKLKEYTSDETDEEKENAKKDASNTLSESSDAGAEAAKDDEYPDFDWNSVGDADSVLPSRVLAAAAAQGDSNMTDVGGNMDDKDNALKKFKGAISAATSFLDGLDRIFADTLADLYVAEYAMQMFSYYTVDKNLDGTDKAADDIITLSGCKMGKDNRKAYKAEAEYILWGKTESKKNIQAVVMTLFGVRLLLNSIYTFTDATLRGTAQGIAHLVCGPAQFLVPIVQVLVQLGYAAVETASDIKWLKQGYGVTIFKNQSTWATVLSTNGDDKANTKGLTLSYAEYMRIFLVLSMMASGDKNILARIADCIQINNDYDLLKGYTMVAINATVKSRTSFMRKISDMEGGPGLWSYADDYYDIQYQSVLGY